MLFQPVVCVLMLSSLIFEVKCECRKSFVTVCDTLEDFQNFTGTGSVSELMIGRVDGKTNMSSLDIMHTLEFGHYHKLRILMIVRAVNNLHITKHPSRCVYDDSPLETLIFYGNIMKAIEQFHFPLITLKKLSLVNNQIEVIRYGALTNMNVEVLDFSDNNIKEIESESLPVVPTNKVLILSNNKIAHIPLSSLSSGLETLKLDHNRIRYIQDEVFNELSNLKELILSHNEFNIFPNIKKLKNLVIFDISHNEITSFKTGFFNQMDNLKMIDLSNNKISSGTVLEWIITPKKQPDLKISIALNLLVSLRLTNVTFENQTVVVYGNPWQCNFWPEIKEKLTGHESDCDVEFVSSGNVPYCVNFPVGNYFTSSQWYSDVDHLKETVRESEKKAGCTLAPERNEWLNPISYKCYGG